MKTVGSANRTVCSNTGDNNCKAGSTLKPAGLHVRNTPFDPQAFLSAPFTNESVPLPNRAGAFRLN